MRRGQTVVICLVSGLLLVPAAHAVAAVNDNAYQTIAVSNPFRLKPPPPPPDTTKPPDPPSKVTLTGTTTIFGDKLALMEVQPPNNKPKIYLTLSEGQREGDIEVVSIDEKIGVVRIVNQGVPQTLTFDEASKRAASAMPAPATAGSIPSVSGQSNPTADNSFRARAASTATPARPLRTSTTASTATDSTSTAAATTSTASGGTTAAAKQEKPLTPEEQIILMEINREQTKEQVAAGKLPPLPPTPLTPKEAPPTP